MKYCASTSTKPSPKPWWKDTIIGVLAHPSNVVKKSGFFNLVTTLEAKIPRK